MRTQIIREVTLDDDDDDDVDYDLNDDAKDFRTRGLVRGLSNEVSPLNNGMKAASSFEIASPNTRKAADQSGKGFNS